MSDFFFLLYFFLFFFYPLLDLIVHSSAGTRFLTPKNGCCQFIFLYSRFFQLPICKVVGGSLIAIVETIALNTKAKPVKNFIFMIE